MVRARAAPRAGGPPGKGRPAGKGGGAEAGRRAGGGRPAGQRPGAKPPRDPGRTRRVVLRILIFLLLPPAVFAFYLFGPVEETTGSIESFVPRSVDLFLKKKRPEDLFREFPRLAMLEDFTRAPGFPAFQKSQAALIYDEVARAQQLVDDEVGRLPRIALRVVGALLRGELGCAIRLDARNPSATTFLLAARLDRLSLGAVRFLEWIPGVFLPDDAAWGREGERLRFGQGEAAIFAQRIADLLFLSPDPGFLDEVQALQEAEGSGSLGQSRAFREGVVLQRGHVASPVEIDIDYRRLAPVLGLPMGPMAESPFYVQQVIADYCNTKAVRRVGGALAPGLPLRIWGLVTLDRDGLPAVQEKFWLGRRFKLGALLDDIGRNLPRDIAIAIAIAIPPPELAQLLYSRLDLDFRRLAETQIKETRRYTGFLAFLQDLTSGLGSDVVLAIRAPFPTEDDARPSLPTLVLSAPILDPESLDGPLDFLVTQRPVLGFGEAWEVDYGGAKILEMIPKAMKDLQLSWMRHEGRFYLSTSTKLLQEVVGAGRGRGSLDLTRGFRMTQENAVDLATVFLYVAGEPLRRVLVKEADTWAEQLHALDLGEVRARESARLRAEGRGRPGQDAFERELDRRVSEAIEANRAPIEEEKARILDDLEGLRVLEGAALSLGGDERNVPFQLFVDVGVGEEPARP